MARTMINENGGTAARGRGRGRRGRGVPPKVAPGTPPAFGGPPTPPAAARGNGGGAKPPQANAGLGGQALPGPGGAQLQRRVASGKITAEQAQRTMQQRQTLQKAFGKDWRDKISGGGKSFAQVNAGLAKNPKNPKLMALRKKLTEGRKSALEAARAKNKGGSGEGGE